MTTAVIVDAVRTAGGKRHGRLSCWHPVDLAAEPLKALVERNDLDPALVDDVIMGCVTQVGPQSTNIARTAVLAAGWPVSVPGTTVDRQCGSSQQAVHFAAQAVLSGTQDLVIAAGVESMSQVPIGSTVTLPAEKGMGLPFGQLWHDRYGDQEISQFRGAEMIADHWKLSREANERFALESHQRAVAAIAAGHFEREISPYAGVSVDEGPRANTSLEKMATLPTLVEDGVLTAAVASQISDGAAALLVASQDAVDRFGLTPRARIHHMSVRGADPVMMLTAPIPATQHALKRAGMSIEDIDAVEINEAFAPVVLAWLAELGADPERVNPNGGAIALGHPIGCTGARLMTSLLHELERTGGRYGLQTMCEGGGQANVTIIERL